MSLPSIPNISVPNVSIPSLPDVPFAAGVPPVLRNPVAAAGSVVNSLSNISIGSAQQLGSGLISNVQGAISGGVGSVTGLIPGAFGDLPSPLSGDSPGVQNAAVQTDQWGIFFADSSGLIALQGDSFKSIDYKQEWRLPNYPMEQGAFQSYNKVQTPFDVKVVLVKSGTPEDLQNFLDSISKQANSITLFNINTPGQTYSNVSISNYSYKRTSVNGVSMLAVEISFLEIRIAPTAALTNTATPNGADTVNSGTVQATPLTTGPNTQTDGAPTSSASADTGAAGPNENAVTPTPASVSPTTAAAVTATKTPAVAANDPNLPMGTEDESNNTIGGGIVPGSAPPVDVNGKPLTQAQVDAGAPTYALAPSTGNIVQSVKDPTTGTVTQSIYRPPPTVQ